MGRDGTQDMNDYLDDYENAAQDYSQMGPMWAELVFPEDFEAMRALYGGQPSNEDDNDQDDSRRR